MFNMNRLSKEQQIRVVAALVEGNSLSLHVSDDGSGAKHRHGTAVGLG